MLAEKYEKTPVPIILRFEVQEGIVVPPKSTNPAHMAGNLDLFGFRLSEDERKRIGQLNAGKGSHDPDKPGMGVMLLNAFKVHD